jgi:hypothetical protein
MGESMARKSPLSKALSKSIESPEKLLLHGCTWGTTYLIEVGSRWAVYAHQGKKEDRRRKEDFDASRLRAAREVERERLEAITPGVLELCDTEDDEVILKEVEKRLREREKCDPDIEDDDDDDDAPPVYTVREERSLRPVDLEY